MYCTIFIFEKKRNSIHFKSRSYSYLGSVTSCGDSEQTGQAPEVIGERIIGLKPGSDTGQWHRETFGPLRDRSGVRNISTISSHCLNLNQDFEKMWPVTVYVFRLWWRNIKKQFFDSFTGQSSPRCKYDWRNQIKRLCFWTWLGLWGLFGQGKRTWVRNHKRYGWLKADHNCQQYFIIIVNIT